jgi:hypothetical protein
VANLYNSGGIDRNEIDAVIQKYGENSSIVALLRVVIHMYAYYMPLDIEDKRWVSQKLRMPLRKIEMQRLGPLRQIQSTAQLSSKRGGGLVHSRRRGDVWPTPAHAPREAPLPP